MHRKLGGKNPDPYRTETFAGLEDLGLWLQNTFYVRNLE